ncbi:MAG: hypothetical protein O2968_18635 [Acidobacteria bacterium]|nr:hypothetical protein [Acidobacteriota bacterium]
MVLRSAAGFGLLFVMAAFAAGLNVASGQVMTVRVERLLDAPIITPETHAGIGGNIQGPSLIRVPDWVENPLGRYYLYFADHKGSYIRLAYADELRGPWRIHPAGSLQIADSHFPSDPPPIPEGGLEEAQARRAGEGRSWSKLPHSVAKELTAPHIASPDVHVDREHRRIIMYFHGLDSFATQLTRVALSKDGIHFQARPEKLGRTYLRAFQHADMTYGIAMPGQIYRSRDGLSGFEEGPLLFNPEMRHCALLKRGDVLYVFWTQVGHVPERILLSTIDLAVPWMEWKQTEPVEVLRPERGWEGAEAPLVPSIRSVAYERVNQLRDPAIFEEGGRVFLLYAVAGEAGIAIAEVFLGN